MEHEQLDSEGIDRHQVVCPICEQVKPAWCGQLAWNVYLELCAKKEDSVLMTPVECILTNGPISIVEIFPELFVEVTCNECGQATYHCVVDYPNCAYKGDTEKVVVEHICEKHKA